MAASRHNRTVAHVAANKIREFWRNHKKSNHFCSPTVEVCEQTAAIKSDMVDGWPPKK